MFYAHLVLAKKGPLARIWLAAHWDKKLTKAHVFETNIDSSVEAIIKPKVKMALRTTGHLLLGVVRIYSRKAKYLLADCNEAFVKIKMAFRPGIVDLPEDNREAAVAAITLTETFHDFDTTMADLSDIDVQAQFSVNQSRPEEITMREDLGNITLVGDDGFGDLGFDDRTLIQDAHMDDTLYKNPESQHTFLDNTVEKEDLNTEKPMDIDLQEPPIPKEDDFGEALADYGENFMGEAGLFEEPPPVPEVPIPETDQHANAAAPSQAVPPVDSVDRTEPVVGGVPEEEAGPIPTEQSTVVPDQTTLVPNEAEAFALEPLDVTTIGTERKAKRKRKLIVDEQKGIASETMKMQLSDTSDIVTTLDLAPPTKKLMHWKETGGVEKLFALPGRCIPSKSVCKFFNKNLITQPITEEEVDDTDRLELEAPEMAREDEHRRSEDAFEAPVLEPPSMLEDPSRVSLLGDTSSMSRIQDTSRISHLEESAAPVPQPEMEPLPEPEPEPLPMLDSPDTPLPMPDTPGPPTPFSSHGPPSPASTFADEADGIFDEQLPEAESPVEGDKPQNQDEEDEVEERRWSKRTQHLVHIINREMDNGQDPVGFKSLLHRNNRKQVASKFYTLLVLKKQQAVCVEQTEPYGDISITRGPRFDAAF